MAISAHEEPEPKPPRVVVFGGSFDPVTLGHLDVIQRAASLFDRTVVAVGRHPSREPLFSVSERVDLLRRATEDIPSVEVASFDGLIVDYCVRVGAVAIVRGVRGATDFDCELHAAHANADIRPRIDTLFFPTRVNMGFVSASLVREIASHGGDVSAYVPAVVAAALARKFHRS
ncbi:MAG: pantetheine-phosphate adenylyltransferase [Polyangiaceae bacterium]|nr:pantetheine-phosphate adenylyltransferase [Polyangiaceae bacterium]